MAGVDIAQCGVGRIERAAEQRREPIARRPGEQDLVDRGQRPLRLVARQIRSARGQRPLHEPHHQRRRDPFTGHVAEHEAEPPTGQVQDVDDVPPDVQGR